MVANLVATSNQIRRYNTLAKEHRRVCTLDVYDDTTHALYSLKYERSFDGEHGILLVAVFTYMAVTRV